MFTQHTRATSGVLTLSEKPGSAKFQRRLRRPKFPETRFLASDVRKRGENPRGTEPCSKPGFASMFASGARPPAHGGDKTGCRRTSRVGGRRPREKPGFRPVGATRCKTGFRNLLSRRVTGRATKAETRFLHSGYRVPPLAVLSDCEEHLTAANLGLCWRPCRRMKLG